MTPTEVGMFIGALSTPTVLILGGIWRVSAKHMREFAALQLGQEHIVERQDAANGSVDRHGRQLAVIEHDIAVLQGIEIGRAKAPAQEATI
jgi:hypothetical protein